MFSNMTTIFIFSVVRAIASFYCFFLYRNWFSRSLSCSGFPLCCRECCCMQSSFVREPMCMKPAWLLNAQFLPARWKSFLHLHRRTWSQEKKQRGKHKHEICESLLETWQINNTQVWQMPSGFSVSCKGAASSGEGAPSWGPFWWLRVDTKMSCCCSGMCKEGSLCHCRKASPSFVSKPANKMLRKLEEEEAPGSPSPPRSSLKAQLGCIHNVLKCFLWSSLPGANGP